LQARPQLARRACSFIHAEAAMELTIDQVRAVAPSASPARVVELLPPMQAAMREAEISTELRAAMWLAQLSHETNDFHAMEENLNYSAAALLDVFRAHFTAEQALAYARQPQRIASRVYADRLGNGDEQGGDGWRYRGRGAIQLTGAANYRDCGRALGVDLLGNPNLAATPACAFRAAAWFWRAHYLNAFADKGDVAGATRAINGPAMQGLIDRHIRFDRACQALGALSLYV
jgi:putative chitinase